jgi:hypothetical protein
VQPWVGDEDLFLAGSELRLLPDDSLTLLAQEGRSKVDAVAVFPVVSFV